MARPLPLDEAAVEFQVGVRELRRRRSAAPLWEAAIGSGDWSQLADAKALAGLLRVADRIAKRMAGRVASTCADGILEPGHGKAA
jgi:hypothetical protein